MKLGRTFLGLQPGPSPSEPLWNEDVDLPVCISLRQAWALRQMLLHLPGSRGNTKKSGGGRGTKRAIDLVSWLEGYESGILLSDRNSVSPTASVPSLTSPLLRTSGLCSRLSGEPAGQAVADFPSEGAIPSCDSVGGVGTATVGEGAGAVMAPAPDDTLEAWLARAVRTLAEVRGVAAVREVVGAELCRFVAAKAP